VTKPLVRFNPAPGWPPAPEGWLPPKGWTPDPEWPPAPVGWRITVLAGPTALGGGALIGGAGTADVKGKILVDEDGLLIAPGWRGQKPCQVIVRWDQVTRIEIDGRDAQAARTTSSGRIAFSPIKTSHTRSSTQVAALTVVELYTTDRVYAVRVSASPSRIRSALGPWVARLAQALPHEASSEGDLVERLRQLAALRDEGILTEGEFATQKAKFLA
jgi:hypothetical protein